MNIDLLNIIFGPPKEPPGTPGTPLQKGEDPHPDKKEINNINKINCKGHSGHPGQPKIIRTEIKSNNTTPPVPVYPDSRGWTYKDSEAWKRCLECEWAWMVGSIHVCLRQHDTRVDHAMRTCTLPGPDLAISISRSDDPS